MVLSEPIEIQFGLQKYNKKLTQGNTSSSKPHKFYTTTEKMNNHSSVSTSVTICGRPIASSSTDRINVLHPYTCTYRR